MNLQRFFLFSLTLLLFVGNFVYANSFYSIEVTTYNQDKLKGELIETYEDRWFWQTDFLANQYILLFDKHSLKKFHFIKRDEIQDLKTLDTRTYSEYKNYLLSEDIIFKNPLVNNATVITGHEGHHKFEMMYGNFAWDIGITDNQGNYHVDQGLKLENYYIFNAEVKSPVDGVVVGINSTAPDNKPTPSLAGDLSNKVNNFLTIHMKENIYLSIVHFKKDTISVSLGDKLIPGQYLGRVGNSGVSYTPHLHYTLYLYVESHDRFISIPGLFK